MKISHNLLFLFGAIYYLLMPFFVGSFGYLYDMPGMSNWYSDFSSIPIENFYIYYIYVFSIFLMFYLGSFLFAKVSLKIKKINSLTYPGYFLGAFFSISIFVALLSIFIRNSSTAFSGYDTYDHELIGMVGTVNVLVTFLCVHALLNKMHNSLYLYFLMLSLLLSSVFLLGLGSRMYVLVPVIALLTFKVNYSEKPMSVFRLFTFSILFLLVMLLVGVWRVGLDFNFEFFVYIFLAEPIFTSWSAASFLQIHELPLIAEPYNFMSSFLNFVPSSVFPNKADFIYKVSDFYRYHAPLGADNIFVSTVGNFGLLVGSFYFFLLGGALSFLKNVSKGDKFLTAYYVCLLAVIPFQLFRDNFAILNKQFYWNMLFVPFMFLLVLGFLRILLIASYSRKYSI